MTHDSDSRPDRGEPMANKVGGHSVELGSGGIGSLLFTISHPLVLGLWDTLK